MLASSIRDPLSRTLLGLTFVTGILDAVSFLGLGQVFAGMMTGNVLFLGFGIAGAGGSSLTAPIIALGFFLVGGGAGGLVASRMAKHPPRVLALGMAVQVALISIGAIVAAAVSVRSGEFSAYAVIALIALAMGVRNTIVRRLGVPELTTTVVTVAVTGLAADSPMGWASGGHLERRSAAVLALLGGALTGALLLKESLVLPLMLAAALTLATGLALGAATGRAALADAA